MIRSGRVRRGSLHLASEPLEYVFGPFRLDMDLGTLKCEDTVVPLPRRLFVLLRCLIEASGKVVSREELESLLWPDGSMAGWNLSQHIYMLRQILDERVPDRQFIMTVHGKGFRFADEVTPAPEPADENLLQSGYDAFACYSRASVLLEQPTAASLGDAIEQFNAALAIDSQFAPALVGVARAYSLLAYNSYAAGDWAFPPALDLIGRALVAAPCSASAHAVNATVTLLATWDWPAAKAAIETAMQLNAEAPLVRASAACLYACAGDYPRAMAELQQALLVAPYSQNLQLHFGRLLTFNQEFQRAVEHFSNVLEIDPDFTLASHYRAEAQIHLGESRDAIADLLCMHSDPRDDVASRLPLLCRAYAEAGEKKKAEETFEHLIAASHTGFVSRASLAMCALGLERNDEAIDYLQRAVADREPPVLLLRYSPWFVRVTSLEFQSVLGKINSSAIFPLS